MPGWALRALELRLAARREGPCCLRVERGLCRRGRRGRRLGGLLGRCSFLGGCRLCRCSLLGGRSLLGGSSGLLCWCCCLLGRCGLLRCYCLLGGSGFLCRCCCLLGRRSLLRYHCLFGGSSFLRRGSLLSGWFFRSCHHVLLGSICKEHFLSTVDRKRSMEMEKNSISMNTGTPPTAALFGALCGGRGVDIHGGVMRNDASPRTAHHQTDIQ